MSAPLPPARAGAAPPGSHGAGDAGGAAFARGASAAGEALLELDALSWGLHGAAFGGPWSTSIGRGDVVAVLGPNGAGKTTLFRTLIGALRPVAGHVRWQGRDAASVSADALAGCVAFVPQQATLALGLTVEEFAMLGRVARLGPFARPSADDRAAVARVLARLGLEARAGTPVQRVSGGERQLAGIARAIVQGARVLVLDEPTSSLDFGNQSLLLAQLERLAAEGFGIVFSTHQPNHAQRVAGRVLAVDGRGVTRFGPAREVLDPAFLSGLYGVEVVEVGTPDGGRGFLVA